jgi:hypothetical protein
MPRCMHACMCASVVDLECLLKIVLCDQTELVMRSIYIIHLFSCFCTYPSAYWCLVAPINLTFSFPDRLGAWWPSMDSISTTVPRICRRNRDVLTYCMLMRGQQSLGPLRTGQNTLSHSRHFMLSKINHMRVSGKFEFSPGMIQEGEGGSARPANP